MLERRIKKYLDDIIDVAYAEIPEEKRNRFHWFKLMIKKVEKETSSGMYHYSTHIIEVYNPSLGTRHLAKCCLHELSHHIDYCINGISGHKKPFYEVYRRLIYAALDMKILSQRDFDDHWSSDANKVRKIVSEYKPHPIDYKIEELYLVRVYNAFDLKEKLKEKHYHWSPIEQVWEKETDDKQAEEALLTNLSIPAEKQDGKPYYLIKASDMYIDPVVYIKADGNAYEERSYLKEEGFHFYGKEKVWAKKVKANECKKELSKLSIGSKGKSLIFSIWNRK